jgi:DNA-binding response OmpR family regulator
VINPRHLELLTPRILVLDDERQIQSSLRLRLAKDYEVVCCSHAHQALEAVATGRFDLCFVDIHMPEMDGLTFIENARQTDAALGYVVLSAFDSSENLHRTVRLHVFDFIGKPLPERHEFEARIPGWIERTRSQRREQALVQQADLLHRDLDSARLDREVELVASETARDALLQTANLLTTIQAHLLSAASLSAARAKIDPTLMSLSRNLEEARKTASAAVGVADSFFGSAYASRDSSPGLIDSGIRQAISIANRMSSADAENKTVDLTSSLSNGHVSAHGLSGIELLLMVVPIIGAALLRAEASSTVGINLQSLARLDMAPKEPRFRGYLWANRKNAPLSHPGVLVTVTAAAPALQRAEAEAWLKGDSGPLSTISARGLVAGLQKSRGLLAISVAPSSGGFQVLLALPV